ncbi:MAG TPA: VCBS repeat-containing protein, partial [Polyangiales bacterium]|nr:VCBS repeat-containing protein [Polyangiales bacterium]
WATPTQDFPDQLQKYALRCANSAVQGSDSDANKQAWWNAAESIALPSGSTPPVTSTEIAFRIGESRNCVLRASDAAQQLTPIPDSTSIGYAFRTQAVDANDLAKLGNTLARIGDVNGDGIDDVLAGGAGRAYLYFGKRGGLSGKASPGRPDVTLIGAAGATPFEFGSRTAGIGDFNRDGRKDFAIAFPGYNGNRGAVYVFYGRVSSDAWPSTVDLTGTNCQADVCFVGEEAAELLGSALSPVGDFDNDGAVDFALSAPGRDVGSDMFGGRLYILLSHAYEASGSRPASFWGTQVSLPSSAPVGFYIDGTGSVSGGDAANTSQVGQAIAAVGNVDANAGSDLLFTAAGNNSPAVTSKLLFLSGRAHNGQAPQLKVLTSDQAVVKDSGTANIFALELASYRNLINTSDNDVPDLLVGSGYQTFFDVYLGDRNGSSVRFAPDTKVRVNGPTGTQFGISVADTFNPNLLASSSGDLDADGLDELLLGTQQSMSSAGAGAAYLFYGDTIASAITSQSIDSSIASRIDPTARSGALRRTVEYVGDVNGDGAADLVVADPDASNAAGGFTVLY